MALSNAKRQRRFIRKLKAQAQGGSDGVVALSGDALRQYRLVAEIRDHRRKFRRCCACAAA